MTTGTVFPSPVLIVGCGYAGRAVARLLVAGGVRVTGTTAAAAHLEAVAASGAQPVRLDLAEAVARKTGRERLRKMAAAHAAVVYAVGPNRVAGGERFVDYTGRCVALLKGHPGLKAFVYLSSTGVYGDREGRWVDESTPFGSDPGPRGRLRQRVEQGLLTAWREWGLPVRILRVAGIYGPGRNVGRRIRAGTYRVIEADPPLVTNRIHVDDLAQAVVAALARGRDGEVYLVADGHPASVREVADHAAALMGMPAPPGESLDTARERLGEANLHLVADRKRCRNRKMLEELEVRLRYSDHRAGLRQALAADGLLAGSDRP